MQQCCKFFYEIVVIIFTGLLFVKNSAAQDVYVNSYFRKDGSFVPSHYRTLPNMTILDNYSTLGNYNPYTGKPGWIEPYMKISAYYSKSIQRHTTSYEDIFNYLVNKDSLRFHLSIANLPKNYKTFFSALYKFQINDLKDANKYFISLSLSKDTDNFIHHESGYWAKFTGNILAAEKEMDSFYQFLELNGLDRNLETIIQHLDKITNPLSFNSKYKWKVIFEIKRKNFQNAINAQDSLFAYSSQSEICAKQHTDLKEWLTAQKDFQQASLSSLFIFDVEKLYNLLIDFILNKFQVEAASFQTAAFKKDKGSVDRQMFKREMINPLRPDKYISEILSFEYRSLKSADTLVMHRFIFYDTSSFRKFGQELSSFKSQPLNHSLLSNKRNANGSEYFINEQVVAGLIQNEDRTAFELYFYCIAYKSKLIKLSGIFPNRD